MARKQPLSPDWCIDDVTVENRRAEMTSQLQFVRRRIPRDIATHRSPIFAYVSETSVTWSSLSRPVVVAHVTGSRHLVVNTGDAWEVRRIFRIHGVRRRPGLPHPQVRVHGRRVRRVRRVGRKRFGVRVPGEALVRRRYVHRVRARVQLRYGVTTRRPRTRETVGTGCK